MLEQKYIYLPKIKSFAFNDHYAVTGQSGSGKSTDTESYLVQKVLKRNLVGIDMGDRGRFENFCYLLPETDKQLIKKMEILSQGKQKPQTVPCEPLLICGRGITYDNKIPKCIKLVSFKQEDMTIKFMHMLLGETQSLMFVLNNLQAKFGDDLNLKDLGDLLFRNEFRGKHAHFNWGQTAQKSMIINRYRGWMQSGMFTDNPQVEKIEFEKYFNMKKKIISFNTYLLMYYEEEIAFSIIMDRLFDLKRLRRIKRPIALMLRELSNFLRYPLCKEIITIICTQGRGYGIQLITDYQSPSQIQPTTLRKQMGYTKQMKAQLSDAVKIMDIQVIPKDVIMRVPYFRAGEGILLTGMRWDKNVLTIPTPHRHANPKKFDVWKELMNEYGCTEYDATDILHYAFEEVDLSGTIDREPTEFRT